MMFEMSNILEGNMGGKMNDDFLKDMGDEPNFDNFTQNLLI